jgi:hypothetical protein
VLQEGCEQFLEQFDALPQPLDADGKELRVECEKHVATFVGWRMSPPSSEERRALHTTLLAYYARATTYLRKHGASA